MRQNAILSTWFCIEESSGCESQACRDAADGVDDGLRWRWKEVTCCSEIMLMAFHEDEHLINCVELLLFSPGGVVEEQELEGGEDFSSSR